MFSLFNSWVKECFDGLFGVKAQGWARIIRHYYVSAGNTFLLMHCWIVLGGGGGQRSAATCPSSASLLGCRLVLFVHPPNRHNVGVWRQAPRENTRGNTHYCASVSTCWLDSSVWIMMMVLQEIAQDFHRLNVLSCHHLWYQRIRNLP